MKTQTKREAGNWICSSCGERRAKFHPQCGSCGRWNTNNLSAGPGVNPALLSASPASARRLDAPGLSPGRIRTGVPFFDVATGGGLVAGTSVLIFGPPGAGKSTLAAQVAFWTAVRVGRPALIVSGEEWIVQVRDRVDRLGLTPGWIWFNSPVELELIERDLRNLKPAVLVIDSVQKLDDPRDGKPGDYRKRRAFLRLLQRLREARIAALLLSQVNRQGEPMGGNLYEHEPDAVFSINQVEGQPGARVLAAKKNRFGPEESVQLKMTAEGLVSA